MKRLLLRKQALISFLLLLISLTVFPQTFTEQTDIVLPGISRGSILWGDYDNDGDADILVAGSDGSDNFVVKIFRNNGGNVFADQGSIFSPAIPSAYVNYKSLAKWVDLNNDGFLDIIISVPGGSSSSKLLMYNNEGNNTFTLKTTIDYSTWQGNSIDCGDYDNDGDKDLLLITNNSSRVFQNLGNYVFSEQNSIKLEGLDGSSCKWADFDNDGDLDIVISGFTNFYSRRLLIYRNDGDNVFTSITISSYLGLYDGSVDWGDYNSDGYLDILLSGKNGASFIYKNNGNGTFSFQTGIILSNISNGDARWGDLDNDGDLDIILNGNSSNVYITKVYINNGNNTFTEKTDATIEGVFESSIDLFDYDNDSDLDILFTGNKGTTKVCKVYKNTPSISNPVPAAPTGISSLPNGSNIVLKWNPVKTDNTPAKSISYNVMVGTTSGGINIVSPASSTVSGFHRISGMGNGNLDTTFVLRNLKKGTYYWKVQAIDASFRGSLFSTEGSFTYSSSIQSSGICAPSVDGQGAVLRWARGNGSGCAVFMKEDVTGSALPSDNTTYSGSGVFKSGSQIGVTGWYCIYNGTGGSVPVSGLKANTSYIFQVMEYDGAPGSEIYDKTVSTGNSLVFKTGTFSELKSAGLLPATNLSNPNNPNSYLVDFDNDNDLDILIVGTTSSKIYRNDGSGTFVPMPVTLSNGYAAACGDYDNDGLIDIAISGNPTKIYKNNGAFSFTLQPSTIIPGTSESGSLDWGDYDNDGDQDMLLTGNSYGLGRMAKVFRNNGDNTFTEQESIILTGLAFGLSKWFDYDNDGFLDLIISGSTNDASNTCKIFRNDTKGNFIEQTGIILPGVTNGQIDFGDYDNDGDADLIITGIVVFTPVTKIFRNEGQNRFVEQTSIAFPPLMYSSAKWGDYDNDGDLDLLLSGYAKFYAEPITKIYRNNGNNTFTEDLTVMLPGLGASSVTWGDYDKDGDLDILLTGNTADEAVSKIYRNDMGVTPNTKPAAPTGITSTVDKSDVTLTWRSVRSDNTPYKAMTYNLKAGTTPGGVNLMAPNSSASDRKVVEPGNMYQDTVFTFKKIPFGTYYWSVQAVDNSFSGGPFSPEGTFTVSPVQAKALSAKIINNNSLLLKWERGNGDRCVVFCKQTSSGTAVPVNNSSYSPDPEYGFGEQIGTSGWFCVYNGRADSVAVTGLLYNKLYSFHIFEYMGGFGSEQYFTQISDGNPGVFSTSLFTEQTSITMASPNWSQVVWGDYDKDGLPDFISPGFPTRIYRNNGNNTFTEKTGIPFTNMCNGSVAWGDYDNDNDLDLIITGGTVNSWISSGPVTKVYRNDGGDVFTEQTQIVLPQLHYSTVDWGDFDNDGDLDIIIAGATGTDPDFNPVTKIYQNNGNNTFTELPSQLTGILRGAVKWVDYDNDGDLDLFLIGATDYRSFGNGIARFYRNNGDKTFTEQVNLTGYGWASATFGDYDNDGDLDLITATRGSMVLYQNQGEGRFVQHLYVSLAYQGACYAAWGDYDNDGYLDFILTNPGLDTKIFRNTHGLSVPGAYSQWFKRQDDDAVKSIGFSYINWIDYDNDGDIDILMAKEYLPIKVFMNNLIMKSGLFKSDALPEAPSGLAANNSPSGIILKWHTVKTDNTPYKTMTYNVKVSLGKDSAYICPGQASATGFRRIVEMGNAQLDTSFLLKNLPKGKYYWRVQAVDQAYSGGVWSAIDSFEVKNVLAFFSADTVCLGYKTTFTNQSVAFGDVIQSNFWNFGDDSTSTLQNPEHLFSSPGVKNVKLIVASATNSDTLIKQVVVKAKPPVDFSVNIACQGSETSITNLTNTTGLTITSWSWDYGDGKGSILQNPLSHGYLSAGNYDIILSATADNGCSGSLKKIVSVGAYPVADITASAPLSFCKGDSVALSVPYNKDYTYAWKINSTSLTGGNTFKYVAKNTGAYSVNIVNPTGNCLTTSSNVNVTTIDAPAAPVITADRNLRFCQGDSVILSVTNNPDFTYHWKLNGGATGSGKNFLIAKNSGDYSLSVSNLSGCSANSVNILTVLVDPKPGLPSVSISGPTTFCQGGGVTFSVPAGSNTFNWRNEAGIISGENTNSYRAVSTGKYRLEITNSSGCTTTTSAVSVQVNPSPDIPVISADRGLEFCQGDSAVLFSTSISGLSYQWKLNGGAIGQDKYFLIAKNSGNYSLSVSNSYGCSANSVNTQTVLVNPKPGLPSVSISGPTTFCQGGGVTFSVPSGSNTYSWRNEAGIISGENTNSYRAVSTGKYRLEITNSSGCITTTSAVNVLVKPSPSIPVLGNTNYTPGKCPGTDPVRLTADKVVIGYKYNWYKDGLSVPGDTLPYLDLYTAGNYKLVSDLDGCTSESAIFNIDFPEGPAKPLIYTQGNSVWYLACSNNSASSYKWYYNNKLLEGADKYYFVANQKLGKYQVSIGDSQGCYTRSDIITIPTGITGISDIEPFGDLVVFPNPSSGIIFIKMNDPRVGKLKISVLSQDGRKIGGFNFEKSSYYFSETIDLSRLTKGMYLVIIELNNSKDLRKIIIE